MLIESEVQDPPESEQLQKRDPDPRSFFLFAVVERNKKKKSKKQETRNKKKQKKMKSVANSN